MTEIHIKSQMRKGLLDFIVLATLKNKSKYPREVLEHINNSGLELVEGTLYPLFLRLHKQELVTYEWQESSGHPRKYYTLTKKGREMESAYEREWQSITKFMNKII